MARIRTIKPDFFSSLTIAELPLEVRLTFIGLWTHVDDDGRCVDDARLVKAAVWPLDDRTAADVETDLRVLSESSLIARYEVDGRSFLQVSGWSEHQRINRPTASKLPGPEKATNVPAAPPAEPSPTAHAQLSEDSPGERKGTGNREGRTTGAAAATRVTPIRDELFETVAEACGIDWRNGLGKSARGALNAAVKDLRTMGADPAEVPRRAGAYRRRYPDAALTPAALAKHWPALNGQPPGTSTGPPVVGSPEWEARERAERERAERLAGEA